MSRRWGVRTLAVAAAVALSPLFTTLPASAQAQQPTTTVTIGSRARLRANGAAISLPVRVSCSAGSRDLLLFVQVAERAGDHVTNGMHISVSGGLCNSAGRELPLVVTADKTPFRPGTAIATATLVACDQKGCSTTQADKEIAIR